MFGSDSACPLCKPCLQQHCLRTSATLLSTRGVVWAIWGYTLYDCGRQGCGAHVHSGETWGSCEGGCSAESHVGRQAPMQHQVCRTHLAGGELVETRLAAVGGGGEGHIAVEAVAQAAGWWGAVVGRGKEASGSSVGARRGAVATCGSSILPSGQQSGGTKPPFASSKPAPGAAAHLAVSTSMAASRPTCSAAVRCSSVRSATRGLMALSKLEKRQGKSCLSTAWPA